MHDVLEGVSAPTAGFLLVHGGRGRAGSRGPCLEAGAHASVSYQLKQNADLLVSINALRQPHTRNTCVPVHRIQLYNCRVWMELSQIGSAMFVCVSVCCVSVCALCV